MEQLAVGAKPRLIAYAPYPNAAILDDMGTAILVTMTAALLLGALGFSSIGALRGLARALLFLGVLVFGGLAALALYGSIALASKGAGVLLFFAIPLGLVALLCFVFLLDSLKRESYFALPPGEQRAQTVADIERSQQQFAAVIETNRAKLARFWVMPKTRRQLEDDLAHARFMIGQLEKMKRGLVERPTSPPTRTAAR
jgi:Zn-dependent protease with chaperone function